MATQLDEFLEVFESRLAEKNRSRLGNHVDEGSATTEDFSGFSHFQSASQSSAEYGYSDDDEEKLTKQTGENATVVAKSAEQGMERNLRKTRVLQDLPVQLQPRRLRGEEQLRLMDPSQPQQEETCLLMLRISRRRTKLNLRLKNRRMLLHRRLNLRFRSTLMNRRLIKEPVQILEK
jgi:hypothetical protein